MKILQIVDVGHSAIARLAKQIIKHNKDIEIRLTTFHPKRPDTREMNFVSTNWEWADVIDIQYWKSGSKIRELFKDLWGKKKKILTHYNPYNLKEETWEDYDKVCVVNNYQKSVLPNAVLMPLCTDLEFFKFNRSNYTTESVVMMCVNRIEGKKGVAPIAQICNELKYKFLLVGRIADGNYMHEVKKSGGSYLEFRNSVTDDAVRKAYYESAVHVCNSIPLFESGTLPILESMSCGLPVFTRKDIGHVPDIYNGQNMLVHEFDNEDLPNLKQSLETFMNSRKQRINMRIEAEKTVKSRSDKTRAEEYKKLYLSLV